VKEKAIWFGLVALLLGIVLLLVSFYFFEADSVGRFWLQSLSISLFPIGFIVLLDRLYFAGMLTSMAASQLSKMLYKNFDEYGVKVLHPRFDYNVIFNEAGRGAEIIVLDTYIPTFALYTESMKKALQRECQIKFLVIDENSVVAQKRALEIGALGFDISTFRNEVKTYLVRIAKAAKSANAIERVSAIKYDDLPCMPIYLIKQDSKSKAYFSFFLNEPSINAPHFEVDYAERGLFPFFESYLSDKWERNSRDANKVVDLKVLADEES